MLPRLLLVSALAVFGSLSGVMGQDYPYSSDYDSAYEDGFDINGLEMLEGRYGQAYPGFAGYGQAQPNIQYGVGQNVGFGQQFGNVGLDRLSLGQIPQVQRTIPAGVNWRGTGINNLNLGLGVTRGINTRMGFNPNQQQQQFAGMQEDDIDEQQPQGVGLGNIGLQQGYGQMGPLAGIQEDEMGEQQMTQPTFGTTVNTMMPAYGAAGGYGGLGAALGTSKKTTMAQPIYAQSMVVPKIITQPILRPHAITQPIIQQHLIQQPIVETRQVIQPVIRRIITQPIIRPEIYESTTIQPTLKTETTVQPHIVQQTVVTPQLQNQYEEQAPIQEKPRTQVAPTQVQPTISGKKGGGGLGALGLF